MATQLHNAEHKRILAIIHRMREAVVGMQKPASQGVIEQFGCDPYLVLISCLLSLRTKDSVSLPASCRLFLHAKTPWQMLQLSQRRIQELIYPTGFYRKKSQQLHEVSADLINRFGGVVPSGEADLLSIRGVGRKTMNLVRGEGFGIPALCVDTHVHRISNRLGIVHTKTPHETELALMRIIPRDYWIEYNRLMVMWGQNICVPVSPFCSRCPIAPLCPRLGVTRHR